MSLRVKITNHKVKVILESSRSLGKIVSYSVVGSTEILSPMDSFSSDIIYAC